MKFLFYYINTKELTFPTAIPPSVRFLAGVADTATHPTITTKLKTLNQPMLIQE